MDDEWCDLEQVAHLNKRLDRIEERTSSLINSVNKLIVAVKTLTNDVRKPRRFKMHYS